MMTEVVPGKLWVGDVEDAFDATALSLAGVRTVLNVASELNFAGRLGVVYEKAGIPGSDIQSILPRCLHVIQRGGPTLVHCLEGKSRSVCVALAYLCLVQHLDWNAWTRAVQHLAGLRSQMDVFPLYLAQTRDFVVASLSK